MTNQSIATEWATLNVLRDARCRALLRERRWGRLAAGPDAWPTILPVNYAFDGENLVLKVAANSRLLGTSMTPVAFEIDDADHDGAWGWSVLVQGPAVDITDALDDASGHLRAMPLKTWAPGRKEHWVRIYAMRITGRSFGEVPGWDNAAWEPRSSSGASQP